MLVRALATALAAVLAMAACAQAPTPSAEQAMAMASQAMAAVTSYRFTGTLSSESGQEHQEASISGEWAAPDRLRWRVAGLGSGEGHVQEIVIVGQSVVASDSDYMDGAWTEQRQLPPGQDIAPGRLLDGLEMESLHIEEEVGVDGRPALLITGSRREESPYPSGSEVTRVLVQTARYSVLLDRDGYRLLRLTMEASFEAKPLEGSDSGETDGQPVPPHTRQRIVYSFHDYGEPVFIELPDTVAP